ncbi:MAG: GNAT family N-acetyltransferase [Muribaculaceae bacterium]|nr:GNAT family N-acetyltransferase [Muribaculaceae bacterium]
MVIRMAKNEDIPRIHELLTQVNNVHAEGRPDLFKSGNRKYTDNQLEAIISDTEHSPIFVLTDDNNVVLGYCFCIVEQFINDNNRTDIKTLYIDDLCVDEAYRRQHIAKRLYDHVLDFARNNGFYNVTLNVWECNPGARAFYDKCGMKPLKTYLETIL